VPTIETNLLKSET